MKKRLLSVMAVVLLFGGVLAAGILRLSTELTQDEENTDEVKVVYDKETVYLWYTDDALTNYLNNAAVSYNEENGTRIMPVLKSGLDFLEAVNEAAITDDVPDIYIVSNDALGKAYLAGLAEEICKTDDENEEIDALNEMYLSTALDAVTYKNMIIAYPFYFDTTALLYNRTYIKDMAASKMRTIDGEDALEAQLSEDEIEARANAILPETMTDITDLADSYDAPENVESFFKWDVTDIFYNYFFLGDAIDVGGKTGWDKERLDIYNEDAIRALEEYQSLNQFFSIDTKDSEYEEVVEDFIEGKIVFTIATTDVVEKLENAREEGNFEYEYGVTFVPDLSNELITRSLSITGSVAVNPFSRHKDVAKDFAKYLTHTCADTLYSRAKKVSVVRGLDYENDALIMFAREYDYSMPLSKMVETGNLWVQLEAAFSRIWDGEDANLTLKNLAEQMIYQVTGRKEDLPKIELSYDAFETEYLDEEALRNEALMEDAENSPSDEDEN